MEMDVKIILNVKSNLKITKSTLKFDNETHIYINERHESKEEDGETLEYYLYDKLVVFNSDNFSGVESIALSYYKDKMKNDEINTMVVTTSTGIRLYADPTARGDIKDAISAAENRLVGLETRPDDSDISELWKTPDGWIEVNLAEFKEVPELSLIEKKRIILKYESIK